MPSDTSTAACTCGIDVSFVFLPGIMSSGWANA